MVVGSINRLLNESILISELIIKFEWMWIYLDPFTPLIIDGLLVGDNWEVGEENTNIKCKFFQLSIKMIHLVETYTLYKYFALPPHNYSIEKYVKYIWYVKK